MTTMTDVRTVTMNDPTSSWFVAGSRTMAMNDLFKIFLMCG